ncbi:MAG: hypothetical protein NVS9B4_01170 [Candidatus Acidiferrum sp.]
MRNLLRFGAVVCLLVPAFPQTTPIHKLDAKGPAIFDNTLTVGVATFAGLGTPANGTILYCTDCTQTNPAGGSGTGALVRRVNGVWIGADAGGSGGGAFNLLTGGTNTTAAMVVGTGASLAATGTGTIASTTFTGALAGDVTGVQGSTVVARVNGTTIPTTATANQVPLTTAPAISSWATLPSCLDASGNHLNFNTATHAFTCGTSGPGTGNIASYTASATWTVPAAVTRVWAQAFGGGAGGGPGFFGTGQGGAGGGYAAYWCAVTPGATITISVGGGGSGAVSGGAAQTAGVNSSFGSCITATGGTISPAPGQDAAFVNIPALFWGNNTMATYAQMQAGAIAYPQIYISTRPDTGGMSGWGMASSGNGDGFAGGAAMFGGGGGGGGSRNIVAGTQAGGPGGISGYGGAGGAGGAISAGVAGACAPGIVPGGGGGGGAWDNVNNRNGCNGAGGQVTISW